MGSRLVTSLLVAAMGMAILPLTLSGCGTSCRLVGCIEGIRVETDYRERGDYVFEVSLDGVPTTCRGTLPSGPSACDNDNVRLEVVSRSASQVHIANLFVPGASVRHIDIHATKDGELLGDSSIDVIYTRTRDINGAGCDPEVCSFARYSFP